MHKLGNNLLVTKNGKKICGQIVGIDRYRLENFEGTQHLWESYTLTSKTGGLFKRFWITDWKKSGWFLWTACKKIKKTKHTKVIQDRSGIAQIRFTGDQGASTPVAALVVYEIRKGEYYATERFADSDVMFFRAIKITKPKILTSPL